MVNENNYYFITKKLSGIKQDVANISSSIIDKTKLKLESSKAEVFLCFKDIETKISSIIKEKENKLNVVSSLISKMNPLEILKSGYALVEKGGKKLTSANNVKIDDTLTINLSDGKFDAKVTKTYN